MPEKPSALDRLREALERAKAAAPDTGIDVTAVAEIPAKPRIVPPPPKHFTDTDKEDT